MADLRQCEFFLLRYVPDVVKGEFVNVGVVLLEEGDGFTGVRFTRDWRRARCADPELDVELLESYEAELQRVLQLRMPEIINYRPAMSRREWLLAQMEQSLAGTLQLSPMAAVFAASPQAELGELAKIYLESKAVRGQRVMTGRRVIVSAMREAFEKEGVWQSPQMRKEIRASAYTREGDPLIIDCGYMPDEVIYMFHGLALSSDVNSAKVLAYSYPGMRDGLLRAEGAVNCTLTAVTENDLDLRDEGVAFALAVLQDNAINVAQVSEMPRIAARARLELKL